MYVYMYISGEPEQATQSGKKSPKVLRTCWVLRRGFSEPCVSPFTELFA